MPLSLNSSLAQFLVTAIQAVTFNDLDRTLDLEGPFGHPQLMGCWLPQTFHTLRGVRAGLVVIAHSDRLGYDLAESELFELVQTVTDTYGLTSFFHTGRTPLPDELEHGGAPVLPPRSCLHRERRLLP